MQCTIQTITPKLEDTLNFYRRLGYTIKENEGNYSFSDGSVNIELNTSSFARVGLRFYNSSWTNEIEALEKQYQIYTKDDHRIITAEGNTWIYLIEADTNEHTLPSSDQRAVLGNYGGISIETGEMRKLSQLFTTLGFEFENGSADAPWCTMKAQNGFSISLMAPNNCPHLFASPSLNYFNNKSNPEIINAIRAKGIEPWEEITVFNPQNEVDNISLRDPGGLGFFVFND